MTVWAQLHNCREAKMANQRASRGPNWGLILPFFFKKIFLETAIIHNMCDAL